MCGVTKPAHKPERQPHERLPLAPLLQAERGTPSIAGDDQKNQWPLSRIGSHWILNEILSKEAIALEKKYPRAQNISGAVHLRGV